MERDGRRNAAAGQRIATHTSALKLHCTRPAATAAAERTEKTNRAAVKDVSGARQQIWLATASDPAPQPADLWWVTGHSNGMDRRCAACSACWTLLTDTSCATVPAARRSPFPFLFPPQCPIASAPLICSSSTRDPDGECGDAASATSAIERSRDRCMAVSRDRGETQERPSLIRSPSAPPRLDHCSLCSPHSPASWKDPSGAEITKRTKEQAIAILQAHRQAIVDGKANFADLARVHSGQCRAVRCGGGRRSGVELRSPVSSTASDSVLIELSSLVVGSLLPSDCGSAQSGGDLGVFGRGAMQKAFEGQRETSGNSSQQRG